MMSAGSVCESQCLSRDLGLGRCEAGLQNCCRLLDPSRPSDPRQDRIKAHKPPSLSSGPVFEKSPQSGIEVAHLP